MAELTGPGRGELVKKKAELARAAIKAMIKDLENDRSAHLTEIESCDERIEALREVADRL